jgi:membrane protein YdbS with pleckstrin-like domain
VLQLFRNNSPYTVLILIILAFLLKLQALSHPFMPVALPGHYMYDWVLLVITRVFGFGAFGYTLLALLMLIGQGLYLHSIIARHRLFSRPTYLPSLAYILITSLHPSLNYFSEPLIVNWILLASVDIMLHLHQTSQPRKQLFNSGFVICLAAIFQLPALAFMLLLLVALILLRPFNVGEWVVTGMGYFTPIYFLACMLFLIDRLPLLWSLPQLGFAWPGKVEHPVYLAGCISGMLILFGCGAYAMQTQLPKATIYIRRSWLMLTAYLIIAIAVAFVNFMTDPAAWLIAMVPLALVIAHALSLEKTKRFSNFAFYFSLLVVIFCQLALNK